MDEYLRSAKMLNQRIEYRSFALSLRRALMIYLKVHEEVGIQKETSFIQALIAVLKLDASLGR